MSAPAADLRPRRLVLAAAELAVLCRLAGDLTLPPGFEPAVATGAARHGAVPGEQAALAAAAGALVKRGAVQPGPGGDPLAGRVHPSVAANLAVLAGPEVLLITRARYGTARVQAAHAVAGVLGASLAWLSDRLAELSLFAATGLGRELLRAVPEPAGAPGPPPAGRVSLDALTHLGMVLPDHPERAGQQAAERNLDRAQVQLVQALARQPHGVLHCLVTGPGVPRRVGQVVWFGTPAGWVGAQPETGPQGERLVRLIPVEREDLGVWVAPMVAEVLGSERA